MRICPACGEQNPARFRLCGQCGAPLDAVLPSRDTRRTITILFSDLVGSTALGEHLDPETLRAVMSLYFDAMRTELIRHGGTIEKYIGDAIMAVFGLPNLHEDDALRAVRAADGMRSALGRLNDDLERRHGVRLASRIGINTGEVVTGDATTGERLATGDAVNTAARLEQAAPAGGVLIGDLTYRLVRDAVAVEPLEPLELKGKADRIPAYRLVGVHGGEGRARRRDAKLVGRDAELARLRVDLATAIEQRAARLVTVLGDAGVGKSRLVAEFVTSLGESAELLAGRCLPYGDGITFWPLVEIVRHAAGIRDTDAPSRARARIVALTGDHAVAERLASVVGLDPTHFPLAEVDWAVRRLLETLAERSPVVVVVDDIHWAEPAFLELLTHVLDATTDAPVLVLCTARPDLLEVHPEWATQTATMMLDLRPLGGADAERIVNQLLGRADVPADVRAAIAEASEGNPLFVEQLLAMLLETGGLRWQEGRWIHADESWVIDIPPTIHALLAARLDRLGPAQRAVIEPASVIGLVFAEAAVTDLSPEAIQPAVPAHLSSLERRRLVRRDPTALGVYGDYRFDHLLIRDAAYAGMLKRDRADLHERFVAWADVVYSDRDRGRELQAILGYHLEQAYHYRVELGPLDDHAIEVGRDGARRLAAAGRQSYLRGDMHAATNLLRRATALAQPGDSERLALLPYLAETLWELGELDEAEAVLADTIRLAEGAGNEVLAADARVVGLFVDNLRGGEGWGQRVLEETARSIPLFEAAGDHAALARTYRLLTWVHGTHCDYNAALEASAEALDHARSAGDFRKEMSGASDYALAAYLGPTPVGEAIARCEAILSEVYGDRGTEALVRSALAQLQAMAGQIEDARASIEAARTALLDLGRKVLAASLSTDAWRIEVLAGDAVAAERGLRRDIAVLDEIGEHYFLSTVVAGLAIVLLAEDRVAEADEACRRAAKLTSDDDVMSQVLWRSTRARIDARLGDLDAALSMAADAVERARATDGTVALADALADEAEVLVAAGRPGQAGERLAEALRLYRQKGATLAADAVAAHLIPR